MQVLRLEDNDAARNGNQYGMNYLSSVPARAHKSAQNRETKAMDSKQMRLNSLKNTVQRDRDALQNVGRITTPQASSAN